MGICIAYSGKLRDPSSVAYLMSDIRLLAGLIGWRCATMTESIASGTVNTSGLDGITLYPTGDCEPLRLHFDREGRFINHFYYALYEDPDKAAELRAAMLESMELTRTLTIRPKGSDRKAVSAPQVAVAELPELSGSFVERGMLYNWTKTQFAGAQVHAAVCAVLRLIKVRYAPDLEVTDDSGYFDDLDYPKLVAQLAEVDSMIALTRSAVRATSASTAPVTLEAFIERINEGLAEASNRQN
jgi:hypothetical protein